MGLPLQTRRYSIEEYLEMERDADVRHEYQDGEILAMSAGASNRAQGSGAFFQVR